MRITGQAEGKKGGEGSNGERETERRGCCFD